MPRKKISFMNCCPHEIHVWDSKKRDGSFITIPKTNMLARLSVTMNAKKKYNGVDVFFIDPTYQFVTIYNDKDVEFDLPKPKDGIMYVVSNAVFEKTTRTDVVKPDMSEESAIRDDKGNLLGVKRLIGKFDYNI